MIQTLLCTKPEVANSLSAVALVGTMLGSDFAAGSCRQKLPKSLPLVWLHGVKDPVLPFAAGGQSLGVKSLGAGAPGGLGIGCLVFGLSSTSQAHSVCVWGGSWGE
jgi:poly(3-hydroxybutyrate) depolymerase